MCGNLQAGRGNLSAQTLREDNNWSRAASLPVSSPPLYRQEWVFLQCSGSNPWPGPVPIRFRLHLSFGLLFKRVPSLSGPLYPPRCFEILSLRMGIKRSKSEQHWAPRTWKPWGSSTKLTTQDRALKGGLLSSRRTRQCLLAAGGGRSGGITPAQRQQPFVWRLFCLPGQKLTPPSLLYKPAHLKGPVSHGFQVLRRASMFLVAELRPAL